jgi:hypothetical protein
MHAWDDLARTMLENHKEPAWQLIRQRHRHRQHDSASTLCHNQVTLAVSSPSPAWLSDSVHTSLISNMTQRFITDQSRGLQEYFSDRRRDLSMLLPIMSTLTWGDLIITTMLWDALPNQLSHFLSCILFWVNTSIYFQLVNILPLVQ